MKPRLSLQYAICVVAACLFTACSALRSNAQDSAAASTTSEDPVALSWRNQSAVKDCRDCHSRNVDGKLDKSDTEFSRLNEQIIWLAEDKHAIARRRVEPLSSSQVVQQFTQFAEALGDQVPTDWFGESNVLSKRICDKLGYEVATDTGYQKFKENCLSCHGGYRGDVNAEERVGFERPVILDPFKSQPGISCNYCHQLGTDAGSREWVAKHGLNNPAVNWRPLAPVEKESFGMRDLVNPANQANLCYDCHVGNRSKNQFVTHEMYAAGHPPLPSVEVETFCEQMPRHWRTSGELYDSLPADQARDKYFQINHPSLLGNEGKITPDKMFWNTRSLLIGAIVARAKTLDLIAESATEDRWADYSLYDCAACHHELRTPSQRQLRGYVAAPGRPRQHEWPTPLVTVALQFSRMHETPLQLEEELEMRFASQPFGVPSEVIPTVRRLRTSLDVALRAAESKPIDANVAKVVLIALSRTPADQLLTYDAARQVAWAMQYVAAELQTEGSPLDPSIASLIASLGDATTAENAVGIDTTLPARRQVFIYPENLKADLDRRAAFEPQPFVDRLQEIGRQLMATRLSANVRN